MPVNAGLRKLIDQEFSITSRSNIKIVKRRGVLTGRSSIMMPDQASSSVGVDCISCHGLIAQQSEQNHIQGLVNSQPLYRSDNEQTKMSSSHHEKKLKQAKKLCDRCHSLPPFSNKVSYCVQPHNLTQLKIKKCSTP